MGRTPCCEKSGLKKGPWTTEEDQKLVDYIEKHGPGNWRALPKNSGLERCGKSCRLRWANYLRPDIKRGKFTDEEEETIIQLHSIMGNKWSAIAAKLPGRTDNEIKNYWNTHIRKKLLRMGIDPVTHGPRLDLLDLQSILTSLHNPSLLNFPAFLNLQTILNPSQTRLSQNLLENPYLAQNQANPSSQFSNQTLYFGFSDKTFNVKTENHVFSEPGFNWLENDQGYVYQLATEKSTFMSKDSNHSVVSNNSTFSSGANPVDESLMYLKNCGAGVEDEDELEIDSFLSKMLEKVDHPCFNDQ